MVVLSLQLLMECTANICTQTQINSNECNTQRQLSLIHRRQHLHHIFSLKTDLTARTLQQWVTG